MRARARCEGVVADIEIHAAEHGEIEPWEPARELSKVVRSATARVARRPRPRAVFTGSLNIYARPHLRRRQWAIGVPTVR